MSASNDELRKAAEDIYTKPDHLQEMVGDNYGLCDCKYVDPGRPALCYGHEKTYQNRITRIMGVMEETFLKIGCNCCSMKFEKHKDKLYCADCVDLGDHDE